MSTAPIQNPPQIREEYLLRLYRVLDDLGKELTAKWEDLVLNEGILLNCVESCLYDMERMRNFHGIRFEDDHKQAAFVVYWLNKLRPLQIKPPNIERRSLLLSNEHFALCAGLRFLKIDASEISNNLWRNFLYTLHYRTAEPMVLATLMYTTQKAIKKEKP